MKKRIISLSLASTLLLGTVVFANNDQALISEVPEKEVINEQVQMQSNYINHKGKITEVNNVNGLVSILVDQRGVVSDVDETSSMAAIKFNLSEDTVVLSAETQELIKADKLVKDLVVEVSYKKDSAMTKSLPPITNADAVVVRDEKEEEKQLGVKVDRFKNQTSVDNFLKYNITEDTVIVDAKGNKLSEKDLDDKNLVVFYGPIMTMSIPAQSNAVKIIVLDEKETPQTPETPEVNTEIKVLDKIEYYSEKSDEDMGLSVTAPLKNKIYKSGDTFMIPIREIAEKLGYKVTWQSVAKQVELTKGSQYLTATKGQDMYSTAKMIVKLGKASKVENGVTFVPVNFIEEVMGLDMEITQDGMISIK